MRRNFANKLWNATRFALAPDRASTQIALGEDGPGPPALATWRLADRWILSRLDATTEEATRLMGSISTARPGKAIREFVWSELCDWYIEAAKVRLRGTPDEQQVVAADVGLRAGALPPPAASVHAVRHRGTLAGAAACRRERDDRAMAGSAATRSERPKREFGALIETVRAIRNARTEAGIEPGRWIAADDLRRAALRSLRSLPPRTGHAGPHRRCDLRIVTARQKATSGALTAVAGNVVVMLPLAGVVDLDAERDRLRKELAAAEAERGRATAQLGNEGFISRAPEKVIEMQRQRLANATEQIELITKRLEELQGRRPIACPAAGG